MNPLPGPHPRGAGPWPRQWPWPLIAYDIGTTYAQYHEANRPSHKLEHKIYDYYSENFATSYGYKIYDYYSDNFATPHECKTYDYYSENFADALLHHDK